MNKIIAIPTRDEKIDDHFGHCDHYTLFTICDGEIVSRETFPSPVGCGCKSNVATQLHEKGVSLMIAGNMGEGAKNKLAESSIEVIRGCSGDIETAISAYLNGELNDSGLSCASHEGEGHQCHGHEFRPML